MRFCNTLSYINNTNFIIKYKYNKKKKDIQMDVLIL